MGIDDKMKLLHINCNYLTSALHQTMIEHLDKTGITNQVFVPTYDSEKSIITPQENVYVAECFDKWDRIIFDYKQKKILNSVEKNIDIKSFNCIHAYTLFTDGNCARNLSKKYGIPYITTVRNTDINIFLKKAFYLRGRARQILGDASQIIFLSDVYRQELLEKYVKKEEIENIRAKTMVIPNGIDDFWHNHRNVKEKPFFPSKNTEVKLIYAGKMVKGKNIEMTQKALEILRSRGWKCTLTIAGGREDESVASKVLSYPNTVYVGELQKEELIDVYRQNDIFVMPSHAESFGLVYAEAMSQGLPVVYTKDQGFDGQFPDGMVGYAVDDKDPNDIANAIEKIVQNYARITSNTQECSKKFKWDCICNKYKTIYQSICI